jgi:hypothetical protein
MMKFFEKRDSFKASVLKEQPLKSSFAALRAYQMREMALSDWTSGINYARGERRWKSPEIARK